MIKKDNDSISLNPWKEVRKMEEEKGRIHVVYKRSAVELAPTDSPKTSTTEVCIFDKPQ